MIPAFSPFLALRYLLLRPSMLLGVLGVGFAVWAMLLVDAVFTGFVGEIRDDVRGSTAALLVTDLPPDTGYEPLRSAIEADPDVGPGATAPRLRYHGFLQPLRDSRRAIESSEVEWNQMESGFALLLGIDPAREVAVTGLRDWLPRAQEMLAKKGGLFPASQVLDEPDPERRARLLLPDEVEWEARRRAGLWRVDGEQRAPALEDFRSEWPGVLLSWRRAYYVALRNGDPIDLVCAAFPPGGAADAVRPTRVRLAFAGYFLTGHRLFDVATAMLPIETLRTQLGHDREDPAAVDLITDVAVRPRDGLSPAQLRDCQVRLQRAVQALLPAGSAPCSVLDWRQQNTVFLGAVTHEHSMMQFVLFVVMLVAAFVIYATLHMMVVQKWKDIGILASLGGTPRGIGLVFVTCGAVVGALGTLLGNVAGLLSVRWLNPVNDWLFEHWQLELFPRRLFDLERVPCRLESEWIVQVAVGALALALLVAFVPARRAARMNPVKALAYE